MNVLQNQGKCTFSRLRGIFGHFGPCGGILGAILGVPWPMLGYLGGSWAMLGRSWRPSCGTAGGLRLGERVTKPGKMHVFALEGYLRPFWAMWRHLGSHLGGTLAYVGVSWGGSWAMLGPSWKPSCGILAGLGWGENFKNILKMHAFAREGYLRPSWGMWRHPGGHLELCLGILEVS